MHFMVCKLHLSKTVNTHIHTHTTVLPWNLSLSLTQRPCPLPLSPFHQERNMVTGNGLRLPYLPSVWVLHSVEPESVLI